ncbi:MAG: hypothetical protein M1140_07340 [Chloroflexi bacterium]|nr:hypothetical protein [Chloroflexota bacterium]
MKGRPASSPLNRVLQILLIVLVIGLVAAVLLSRQAVPAPAGSDQAATATPDDAQRNATKAAMLPLEKQTGAGAPPSAPPSAAEVARKQPRRPESPEQSAFQPFPDSTPAGPGAIAQVQPPFSNSLYHIENSWYSDTASGTQRLTAYAGNVAGPGGEITDQGVVVLQSLRFASTSTGPEIQIVQTDAYTNTAGAGSLHITGADTSHLFLQSVGGQTFSFDLAGRVFVLTAAP